MKPLILLILFSLLYLAGKAQTTVTLSAGKDNTLYEDPSGNLSNGAGQHMFAGNTATPEARRAVIHFDIAATIPSNATITSVTLRLNMSKTSAGNETIALHRLTKDWGEGTSDAPGQEGGGTNSTTNDATWIHTFFSSNFWTNAGGDYNGTASASTSVGGVGPYTWTSAQLTTDVQDMLNSPGNNFGWIIIGNEGASTTAKRFDTREHPTSTDRPELEVTYTLPPAAQSLVINEVDYDQPGTDTAEFIELKNVDPNPIDLSNYSVELVNGSGAVVYQNINLPSVILQPGDYFVICANNSTTPNCDLQVSPSTNLIQNGSPDAVAIRFMGSTVVDAVSYEGNTAPPYTEGTGITTGDNNSTIEVGLSRFPDGTDTDNNDQDFTLRCITPGLPNQGPIISIMANGNTQFCPGKPVQLIATGASSNPQWYRNGKAISGAMDTFYFASMAGTYNLMADFGSCRDSAASGIILTEAPVPTVKLGPDTTVCLSYLLDAGNPGASYIWNTGSQSRFVNAQQTGRYSVTVTNASGCSDADTISVEIGTPFSISLADTLQNCDQVVLNPGAIQNAQYAWSTGDTTQTITVSNSGNYSVTVTRDGCEDIDSTYAAVIPPPDANAGSDVAMCDSAILIATSTTTGVSFSWSTGTNGPVTKAYSSGNYIVTVTDPFGCTSTDTVNVTIHPNPSVNLGADFQACDSTTLDAGNAGSTYFWNTGATTQQIPVTTTGSYAVTVTNSFGCASSDTVQVTLAQSLAIDLGPDTTVCDSYTLNAGVPGAVYSWSTGASSQSITITNSGNYFVTVTQGSCSSVDSIAVTIVPSPNVNLGPDRLGCVSVQLLPAGGPWQSVQWNTGDTTTNLTVNQSGVYTISVTNSGCTSSDTVDVIIDTLPAVDLGPDTSTCEASFTLDAGNPGAFYQWSTSANTQQVTVASSGIYSVTVTNGACVGTDAIFVTFLQPPTLSIGPDIGICPGDTVSITGSVTGSYQWSTGDTGMRISITQPGFYSATVTDINGCTDSDTLQASLLPGPSPNLGADTTVCDSIQLSASGGVSYRWQDGTSGSTYSVTSSGSYSVLATDANGCQGEDTVAITIETAPTADFTFDTSGCPVVQFTNFSLRGDSYSWDFGDGSAVSSDMDPTYTYADNGLFTVLLTVNNECGTDTFTTVVGIDCLPNGIDQTTETSTWSVYPNPASTVLNIQPESSFQAAKWYVLNISGQLIREGNLQGFTQVPLTDLPKGLYLLEIRSAKDDSRIPFIIGE